MTEQVVKTRIDGHWYARVGNGVLLRASSAVELESEIAKYFSAPRLYEGRRAETAQCRECDAPVSFPEYRDHCHQCGAGKPFIYPDERSF